MKDDLRFVYCGHDRQEAEKANVPGTHMSVGATYGEALTKAAIETAQAGPKPRFVSGLKPKP